jgi:ABC-type antimicrobial peptide transport system permease subunit
MRPAWRLSISDLSARPSRTLLLIATVVLASGLIAAVSCSLASMHTGLRTRVESTVGASDIRIDKAGKDLFDESVLRAAEKWPESRLVVGRLRDGVMLRKVGADNVSAGKSVGVIANGVMLNREFDLRPLSLDAGRLPSNAGEVVIDAHAAKLLGASVNDVVEVVRPENALTRAAGRLQGLLGGKTPAPSSTETSLPGPRLTVVGIAKQPAIGMGVVTRAEIVLAIDELRTISSRAAVLSDADVVLRDSSKADAIAKANANTFEQGIVVRASEKITSGLNANIKQSQIGMSIISVLAYLASSFIIMTGLTTNVNEKLRQLAMLRCIGGTRFQLAETQLVIGLLVGICGAIIGVPLGMLGALALVKLFPEQLPGGFAINPVGLILAVLGSIGAGLLGALWPAIRAARTSPLEALAVRSKPARTSGLVACGVIGLALAALQLCIIFIPSNANIVFWGDISVGLPSMFIGYFLLSVPVFVLVTFLLGPLLSLVMRIPVGLLQKTVLSTPYRFGFTAGAMMMGLALLVAIWTNGRSVIEDWLKTLKFPDAFVAGVAIPESTRDRIAALPFVSDTVGIQMLPMHTKAFGLDAFGNTGTTFIAFEPEPFFKMTALTWVQGDPATAIPRLKQGGAVLVAREFNITRGIGVGDRITLEREEKPYTFEVVGVVSSPGLDIVNKWFEIGEEYSQQAVNAVFGSRDDLKKLFGVDSIRLLQIGLKREVDGKPVDDQEAMETIREVAGAGIIDGGSGRQILDEIRGYLTGSLYVFSLVAVGAMLVACFGVANLIVAGIQARQFEFGVLRAIGAQPALLARLVLGEALLIALTACIMGSVMGTHGAKAGQRVNELLIGLKLSGWPPVTPVLLGCLTLTLITLAAATPAILSLNRKKPRELLGAVRG